MNWTETTDETILREYICAHFQELSTDAMAEHAAQNQNLLRVLINLMKESSFSSKLGTFAHFSVYLAGPIAYPLLRRIWQKEYEDDQMARLHICLRDILGGSTNDPETRRQMSVMIEQEYEAWIRLMRVSESRSRGWILWLLIDMCRHTPVFQTRLREQIAAELELGKIRDDFVLRIARETLQDLQVFA